MSDPAVEAAQRAIGEINRSEPYRWAELGAREALKQVRDDLQFVDGVLGLLHHRGLVDTEQNRADIKSALAIVQRYTR